MGTEIRRRRQTLLYSGQAFILFGIWNMIKIFMWIYLNPIDWATQTDLVSLGIVNMDLQLNILMYILVFIGCLIDIGLRFYIGASAIREGRGQTLGIKYLIMTIAYMIFIVFSYTLSGDSGDEFQRLWMALPFDVTNVIILVAISLNSYKLRKLTH